MLISEIIWDDFQKSVLGPNLVCGPNFSLVRIVVEPIKYIQHPANFMTAHLRKIMRLIFHPISQVKA